MAEAKRKRSGALGAFMKPSAPAPAPETEIAEEPQDSSTRRGRKPNAAKSGREQFLIYMQPEGKKQIKLLALERGVSASDCIVEAVNEWLQKHGRPPVA